MTHDDEVTRLRALLAAARLERDELARRLAAAIDEPTVPTVGQDPLPLPGLPLDSGRLGKLPEAPVPAGDYRQTAKRAGT